MPIVDSLAIKLTNPEGQSTQASVEQRRWTRVDANGKALKWGAGIGVLALIMLPIPIVHFGIIPLLLVGLPVTLFAVYKLYSGGTDIRGTVACPSCGQTVRIERSGDDYPLSGHCPSCRKSYVVEPVTNAS